MMDFLVEAQNNFKRAGCDTLSRKRGKASSRLVHAGVMKSPGLKPIEAENARSNSACSTLLSRACLDWTMVPIPTSDQASHLKCLDRPRPEPTSASSGIEARTTIGCGGCLECDRVFRAGNAHSQRCFRQPPSPDNRNH